MNMVYKMFNFYKRLSFSDRIVFLQDLFYLARYDPSYYVVSWFSWLFVWFFFSFRVFLFSLLSLVLWYFFYGMVVLTFIYKYKKKHLNT